jgi:subtilisin family serine protease
MQVPGSNTDLDFSAGHGAFVTGIIQQVAPTADIRVYRAVQSDGIGSELDIAGALLQAARDGA